MKFTPLLFLAFIFVWYLAVYANAASAKLPPLQTVEYVDIKRYLGDWYEIARFPNRFQDGCLGSKAHYSLRPDGELNVLNSCRNDKDGNLRQAKGHAWVVDNSSNAKLKVSFFWPFRGDYWIIDLGKDYEYVAIGTPSRKYLWILARTPKISKELFEEISGRVEKQGFDIKNLLLSESMK